MNSLDARGGFSLKKKREVNIAYVHMNSLLLQLFCNKKQSEVKIGGAEFVFFLGFSGFPGFRSTY